jgi:hypothetical protein
VALPEAYTAVLGDYTANLARAPVSAQTRRTYASKVRQFLVWLEAADTDGDPLREPAARDWAVRDYRTYLHAIAKRAPRTVNNGYDRYGGNLPSKGVVNLFGPTGGGDYPVHG